MRLCTPLPRSVTRLSSAAILLAWVFAMTTLVHQSYLRGASPNLATDLARYGSNAEWRGVYYRGDKIGFTVSQTVPDRGRIRAAGGRPSADVAAWARRAPRRSTPRRASIRTSRLRSFEFSLDPGTGADRRARPRRPDAGRRTRRALVIAITSGGSTRTRRRASSPEVPVLSQNFSRLLAGGRLTAGSRQQWTIFDPATLRNAPVTVEIGDREVVRNTGERPIPAFRVEMEYQGLRTTSWITDTGDVVREESPLGLITVREPADRAQTLSGAGARADRPAPGRGGRARDAAAHRRTARRPAACASSSMVRI